jgi:hypothetical protein
MSSVAGREAQVVEHLLIEVLKHKRVLHTCNLSTQEAETGGSQVQNQHQLHREILS